VSVLLNCIGRAGTREKFGAAILAHVATWLKDQKEDVRAKAVKNPLRLLDTKDDDLKAVIKGAPSVMDFLEDESRAHFEAVQKHLTEAQVAYVVRPDLVRGLDYYTDTVFEVQSEGLGSQNALCGGGRYDWLIKELGGPDTPSVGVAMGMERALMVMEIQGGAMPTGDTPVFIVSATDNARPAVATITRSLRAQGIAALADIDDKPLKNQMKQADRSGAVFTVIVGDDEIANDSVTLKDLRDGSQRNVARSSLVEELGKVK
jgi:histidyl-tRNA synthetase